MFHKATLGMTKRASKVCQGSSPDAAVHPLMWAKIYKLEVCMYRHFFTNYIHIQIILALVYIYAWPICTDYMGISRNGATPVHHRISPDQPSIWGIRIYETLLFDDINPHLGIMG